MSTDEDPPDAEPEDGPRAKTGAARDVDPDALRRDVDAIKEAMGLEEQYSGVASFWLLFGVLTAVAAALSQVVHSYRLRPELHTVIWLSFVGVSYVGVRIVFRDASQLWRSRGDRPNLFAQFLVVYVAALPLQVVAFRYVPLEYVARTTVAFAIVLVVVGVGYLVVGESLKAYRIRRRDRLAFYLGGLWIAALGTAVPYSSLLAEWHYAIFGGAYLAYALVAYALLTSTDGRSNATASS